MLVTDNFSAKDLRRVLGSFTTGVTVVTTVGPTGKHEGLTANSFTSVSLDPPLVLWNQAVTAGSHPVFRDAERFAINILAEHQVDLSQHFARPHADKFAGLAVTQGLGGIYLIDDCAATLECRKVAIHISGDHAIFIGHVERIGSSNRASLAFGGGRYMAAHPLDLGELTGDADPGLHQVQAVRAATPILCALATELQETLALSILTPQGPTVVRWEPGAPPASTRLRMGAVPLLGSATGRLFAAGMSRAEIEVVLRNQGAHENLSSANEETFREIRSAGHSIGEIGTAEAEASQLTAVAVPVLSATSKPLLAFTALRQGDAPDIDARLLPRLKQAASSLSARLGLRDAKTS